MQFCVTCQLKGMTHSIKVKVIKCRKCQTTIKVLKPLHKVWYIMSLFGLSVLLMPSIPQERYRHIKAERLGV